MLKTTASLRPSETSLIIQSQIEALTPQQLLIRNELVREGVPEAMAQEYLRDFAAFQKSFALKEQELRKDGAPEWFLDHLKSRLPHAVGEAYAEDVTGQL